MTRDIQLGHLALAWRGKESGENVFCKHAARGGGLAGSFNGAVVAIASARYRQPEIDHQPLDFTLRALYMRW
jgi:hypothetical protein